MFQTAFKSFSITSAGTSALQSMSGPLGGFLVAPQFDASFIRIMEQNGRFVMRRVPILRRFSQWA
jgi:hypothetical protein